MINIAIIPARSGSKRIKNKNIINFCGKPMIYWPIKTLINSKIFNSVYVSTDSLKIKQMAKKYGAQAPFLRPKNISTDSSSTIDVVKHLTKYLDNKKVKYDNICCVYPTSVFLKKSNIIKGYKKLLKENNQLIFSANKIDSKFLRSFYHDKNKKKIKILFPKNIKKRTQDLREIYIDSAQFYWGTKKFWKQSKEIINKNSSFIELNPDLINDIDNLEDYEKAKIKFKKFFLNKK